MTCLQRREACQAGEDGCHRGVVRARQQQLLEAGVPEELLLRHHRLPEVDHLRREGNIPILVFKSGGLRIEEILVLLTSTS